MNIIDLISIIPFYVELIYYFITGELPNAYFFTVIRILRIFRVAKVGRFVSQLQVLLFFFFFYVLYFSQLK